LHTWLHLSWFLFGFSLCEVLDLVVIFTTSQAHQKWISDERFIVFGVEGFNGLSLIERLNISLFGFTFCGWTMMFLSIKL
jgi:hypothetical protein